MKARPIHRLFNLFGGSLTLVSLSLPWFVARGTYAVSIFHPSSLAWFAPWLVLLGGGLSFLSRYGALFTTLGFVAYEASPPTIFLSTTGSLAPSLLGSGFWLAWVGTIVALFGDSWNLDVARIELANAIKWGLPPYGIVLMLFGGFTSYSGVLGGLSLMEVAPGLAVLATGVVITLLGLVNGSTWTALFHGPLS